MRRQVKSKGRRGRKKEKEGMGGHTRMHARKKRENGVKDDGWERKGR